MEFKKFLLNKYPNYNSNNFKFYKYKEFNVKLCKAQFKSSRDPHLF